MEVICDTNIWYNVGNGNIILDNYKDTKFIATFISIDELTKSKKNLDNINSVIIRNTIEKIYLNKHFVSESPFYNLLLDSNSHEIDIKNENINIFINGLLENRKLIEESRTKLMIYIDERENSLRLGVEFIQSILNEIKQRNIPKRNIKRNSIFNRTFVEEIIKSVTNQELPNNFDWYKIELFENTLKTYFYKLLTSDMTIKLNDWQDLAFLTYVKPNQKFWSADKRLNNLIKESGLDKYLFLP